jgi:hypothetical protein
VSGVWPGAVNCLDLRPNEERLLKNPCLSLPFPEDEREVWLPWGNGGGGGINDGEWRPESPSVNCISDNGRGRGVGIEYLDTASRGIAAGPLLVGVAY